MILNRSAHIHIYNPKTLYFPYDGPYLGLSPSTTRWSQLYFLLTYDALEKMRTIRTMATMTPTRPPTYVSSGVRMPKPERRFFFVKLFFYDR
jgi:hypothetical protein